MKRAGSRHPLFAVLLAALLAVAILGCGAAASVARGVHLTPIPPFGEGTWSPDSAWIAVAQERTIELVSADGKKTKQLAKGKIGYLGFPCECAPGWSADSTQVLFLSHPALMEGDDSAASIGLDGSGLRTTPLGMPVGSVAWSPDGWPLFFVPNERTIDIPSGKHPGPAPDLWRLDSPEAVPRKILAAPGEEHSPQLSPDGSQLLYFESGRHGTSLRVVGSDGSDSRVLVRRVSGVAEAAWSPDGSQIALTNVDRNLPTRLYVLPSSGGRPRQIVDAQTVPAKPAWTPDGRCITYSTFAGEIRSVRPDGSADKLLARFPGKEVRGLAWSPDGTHLAYSAHPFSNPD